MTPIVGGMVIAYYPRKIVEFSPWPVLPPCRRAFFFEGTDLARPSVSEQGKGAHPGMMRSVLQFTGGFLLLALIMLGVGGTIYKLMAPEGWLAQLLGGSLNYLSAIALALVGVACFAWFAQDNIAQTRRDKVGDWWVYVFAAAGLIYAWQIFFHGNL
jgi:hypothetical protein